MAWPPGVSGNARGSGKTRQWQSAIERSLARNSRGQVDHKAIDDCADALVKAAKDGDMAAIREIGERLDGKSIQQVNVGRVDPFDELTIDDLVSLGTAIGIHLASLSVEAEAGAGEAKAGAVPALPKTD